MRRTLSHASATAAAVLAMVSLVQSPVAAEPTATATQNATAGSQPTSGVGDEPSGHAHQVRTDDATVTASAAPLTTPPQSDPSAAEDGQGPVHAQGHNAQERTPDSGTATQEGHGDEEEHLDEEEHVDEEEHGDAEGHGDAAVAEDRPRALVLGGFGLFNGAVLVYAAMLRRRAAPDRKRRREARAASLNTDTKTAKGSR